MEINSANAVLYKLFLKAPTSSYPTYEQIKNHCIKIDDYYILFHPCNGFYDEYIFNDGELLKLIIEKDHKVFLNANLDINKCIKLINNIYIDKDHKEKLFDIFFKLNNIDTSQLFIDLLKRGCDVTLYYKVLDDICYNMNDDQVREFLCLKASTKYCNCVSEHVLEKQPHLLKRAFLDKEIQNYNVYKVRPEFLIGYESDIILKYIFNYDGPKSNLKILIGNKNASDKLSPYDLINYIKSGEINETQISPSLYISEKYIEHIDFFEKHISHDIKFVIDNIYVINDIVYSLIKTNNMNHVKNILTMLCESLLVNETTKLIYIDDDFAKLILDNVDPKLVNSLCDKIKYTNLYFNKNSIKEFSYPEMFNHILNS